MYKRKIVLFATVIVLAISFECWATTYYVDATNGNDSNAGTSQAAAWRTIDKVNRFQFQPGDFILFKRGKTWREKLSVSSSGSEESPITYSSYGSGADPIITGTDQITGWSIYSRNIYRAFLPTECYVVLSDGNQLQLSNGNYNNLNDNEWDWNDNFLYVNINSATPGEVLLEASQREDGILLPNRRNIAFNGLFIYGVNNHGINIGGKQNGNITIKNCTIKHIGFSGIKAVNSSFIVIDDNTISQIALREVAYNTQGISLESSLGQTTSGKILKNNISFVYSNTGQGITLGGEGTVEGVIISDNKIMHVYDDGIKTYLGNNIIIENNIIHDTGDSDTTGNSAICVYANSGYSVSATVRYNLLYHNRSMGISVNGSDGKVTANVHYNIMYDNNQWSGLSLPAQLKVFGTDFTDDSVTIHNNVVYGGNQAGIMFEGDPNIYNVTAKNNIAAFNGGYDLDIRGHSMDIMLDNNCYYKPSGNIIYYNGDIYNILGSRNYQTGKSQDANSIFKDPLFVNPSGSNFELNSGSPCIDAGIDTQLQRDFNGIDIPQGNQIEIGAFEYTGISVPKSLKIIPLP